MRSPLCPHQPGVAQHRRPGVTGWRSEDLISHEQTHKCSITVFPKEKGETPLYSDLNARCSPRWTQRPGGARGPAASLLRAGASEPGILPAPCAPRSANPFTPSPPPSLAQLSPALSFSHSPSLPPSLPVPYFYLKNAFALSTNPCGLGSGTTSTVPCSSSGSSFPLVEILNPHLRTSLDLRSWG